VRRSAVVIGVLVGLVAPFVAVAWACHGVAGERRRRVRGRPRRLIVISSAANVKWVP